MGLRFAAAGAAEGWLGASIYRSDDGGAHYSRQIDITTPACIGRATSVLQPGLSQAFDEQQSFVVSLLGAGELSSQTELAVLNGANAALLGDEIIQFKNATLLSPGQYRLSGLLRGRLGTEYAMASHAEGERFVLLDGRTARQNGLLNLTGLPRQYKAVSVGGTLESAVAQAFTSHAESLKPLSPVHIKATRDVSGNLAITWIRRTRGGGEWRDYADAPLNEASESYALQIMNGTSLARTYTLNAPNAFYSAADQITDFGAPQSTLTLRLAQISQTTGPGHWAEATM